MNLDHRFTNGRVLNPFAGEMQEVETFDPQAVANSQTADSPIASNEPIIESTQEVKQETATPVNAAMAFATAFDQSGGSLADYEEPDDLGAPVASENDATVIDAADMTNVINDTPQIDNKHVFVGSIEPIATDIATVSAASQLVESSAFNETLAKIPETVVKVNGLLEEYRESPFDFIEAHDEKELDALVKEIGEVNAFANNVKNKRKDIKQYFDQVRDEALGYLDKRLTDAEFDALQDAQSDIRQLKNDISAQRINKRWEELKATFDANLQQYPLIAQMAPSLQDFSRFKLLNADMVSGAKSKKVTKKVHAQVNEIMFSWNTGLESIRTNVWGLNDVNLMNLLTEFINDPSVQKVTEKGAALKHRQDAELEAARQREILLQQQAEAERLRVEAYNAQQAQLAEQARIAAEARSQQQAQEVARQQEALRLEQEQAIILERQRREEIERITSQFVPPVMQQSYPAVMDYIFANPQYRQIHGDDRVKAMVIYDLVQQMTQPNSAVVVDTKLDPTKVLNLVRFVLDA